MYRYVTLATVIAGGLVFAASTAVMPVPQACAQKATMSYSEDIEPIFKGWCVECHQPGGQGYDASRLDLTTSQGLMTGTKFGPMVIPGDPDSSNL
jgi:mono/diheme cytochrome c family protein